MTDNQRAYEAAICEVAHVDDIGGCVRWIPHF